MTTAREKLIDWLRDAHGAEEEAHSLLKQIGGDIRSNMEFSIGLERAGERAAGRATALHACLEQLGADRSLFKSMTGLLHAQAQSICAMMTSDEPAKALSAAAGLAGALGVSYRMLTVAAETAGEPAIKQACQGLSEEVSAFAEWLQGQAPQVAARSLSIEAAPPVESASLPTG